MKTEYTTFADIHEALKTDLAYQYSLEHKDVTNMQMVLRAYGYDHSAYDAARQIEHCG